MGEADQPPPLPPEPPAAGVPPPMLLPRHSLPKPHDDGPENGERRGLPTWMWVTMVVLFVVIGLPLLAIGGLFLFCYFGGGGRFSMVLLAPLNHFIA